MFYLGAHAGHAGDSAGGRGRGVPGVAAVGGSWEGTIPGTTHPRPDGQIDAYLRNINLRLVHTAV